MALFFKERNKNNKEGYEKQTSPEWYELQKRSPHGKVRSKRFHAGMKDNIKVVSSEG